MAYVTRAMRRKFADDAYEAAHPELPAQRRAYRAAAEKAMADVRAKYPVLATDNFADADAYRVERTKFHLGE